MKVTPIKTDRIPIPAPSLTEVLDTYLHDVPEGSILAITSKVVSLCERALVRCDETNKDELTRHEASRIIPRAKNPYNIMLTMTRGFLIPSAGIDVSRENKYFILWPRDPQKTADAVRRYLSQKYQRTSLGIIITDSASRPLVRGVTGIALAHSGFEAHRAYNASHANIALALATSAVLLMGEGRETTPLALISECEDIPGFTFQDRDPTEAELAELRISPETDLYRELLLNAGWEEGGVKVKGRGREY